MERPPKSICTLACASGRITMSPAVDASRSSAAMSAGTSKAATIAEMIGIRCTALASWLRLPELLDAARRRGFASGRHGRIEFVALGEDDVIAGVDPDAADRPERPVVGQRSRPVRNDVKGRDTRGGGQLPGRLRHGESRS